MTRRVTWVIGGGGRLGRAVYRQLAADPAITVFTPTEAVPWTQPVQAIEVLERTLACFASLNAAGAVQEVYWAAGRCTMGSDEAQTLGEAQLFKAFLEVLGQSRPIRHRAARLVFVSSAGALYAGSTATVVDETSPLAPNSAYARSKLAQEEAITTSRWLADGHQVLVARASTLFGPGSAKQARGGLLTALARAAARRQPFTLHVPLQTVRDFLSTDDAARVLVHAASRLSERGAVLTKLVVSGRPTTVAEVLALTQRLARRRIDVAFATTPASGLYSGRCRFRSLVLPECGGLMRETLSVGMARLIAGERQQWAGHAAAGRRT